MLILLLISCLASLCKCESHNESYYNKYDYAYGTYGSRGTKVVNLSKNKESQLGSDYGYNYYNRYDDNGKESDEVFCESNLDCIVNKDDIARCVGGICDFCAKCGDQVCVKKEREVECLKTEVAIGGDDCQNDDECDAGETCNRKTGRCIAVGCSFDSDCPGTQTCYKDRKCYNLCHGRDNCNVEEEIKCINTQGGRNCYETIEQGEDACYNSEECEEYFKSYLAGHGSHIKCQSGVCVLYGCDHDAQCSDVSVIGGCSRDPGVIGTHCDFCKYHKKVCGEKSECEVVGDKALCYLPTNPNHKWTPFCPCPSYSTCNKKGGFFYCECIVKGSFPPACAFPRVGGKPNICESTVCPSPLFNCQQNADGTALCYCRYGELGPGICNQIPSYPSLPRHDCGKGGSCRTSGCKSTAECREYLKDASLVCINGNCIKFDCQEDIDCKYYDKGGGCRDGKCDPCKYPEQACGTLTCKSEGSEQACMGETTCPEACKSPDGACDRSCSENLCRPGKCSEYETCKVGDKKTIICECTYGYNIHKLCNPPTASPCQRWTCPQHSQCIKISAVEFRCECLYGGSPPNCEDPIISPPPPKCPTEGCEHHCLNTKECQIWHGYTRLVCHDGQCVVPGCVADADCGPDYRCEKGYCIKCKCKPNETCRITSRHEYLCEKTSCKNLKCPEICVDDSNGPRCSCFDNSLEPPDCRKSAHCSRDEDNCGSFAACMKCNYGKIHCTCLHGGSHPHCKRPNNICTHLTCANLRQRCVVQGGISVCQCRFGGVLGQCGYLPSIQPYPGRDDCTNDIECQETFNNDYFCNPHGLCIIQGCRMEFDCPGGGCSVNGYCDPCERGQLLCKQQNKACVTQGSSFTCKSACREECPPGKICQLTSSGSYECICRNGNPTYDCKDPCEKCIGHLSECKINSAGHARCVCKNRFEIFPDCKCRLYCGPNSICTNNAFEGYCRCKDGFSGAPPNCRIRQTCSKVCQIGKICVIEEGKEVCKCRSTDCNPYCDKYCGRGRCIIRPDGAKVCVCDNGYTPPSCVSPPGPICKEDCGYGACKVTSDGVAECVCENEDYLPPACSPGCQKKCGENQVCMVVSNAEYCVCRYGGVPPDCSLNPCEGIYCDKKTSYCIVENGVAKCRCYTGGHVDRNCQQPTGCYLKNCLAGSFCRLINGIPTCICYNGKKYPNCIKCDKHCQNGKCVYDPYNHKSKCECKNGIGAWPDCSTDPCASKKCPPNSECVYSATTSFEVRCGCKKGFYGTPPHCYPSCMGVICQSHQKCIVKSKGECICKQPGREMPDCLANPCENVVCGKNSLCTIDEYNQAMCTCVNPALPYPCCTKSDSCNPCTYLYCGEEASCTITSLGSPECICNDRRGIYPRCKDPSCDLTCNDRGQCFTTFDGKQICLCKEKNLFYPDCKKPCLIPCLKGSYCDDGICKCKNAERQYPNCLTCDDIRCFPFQCNIVNGEPTCLCNDGTEPPCSECTQKCPTHTECFRGKCVTKCNCHESSRCLRDSVTFEPHCVCNNLGQYPICETCNCNTLNETCITNISGQPKCVCKFNLADKCPRCDEKDCHPYGRCGIANGVEQCVCDNPQLVFPDCEMSCQDNMVAAIYTNHKKICLCKDLSKPIDGRCHQCTFNSDCGMNQVCVADVDGNFCRCRNPLYMPPLCREDCYNGQCLCKQISCPPDKYCSISGREPVCLCKNGKGFVSNCNGGCSPEMIAKCRKVGGKCRIVSDQEVCDCGDDKFKQCMVGCDPPCTNGLVCLATVGGIFKCVCDKQTCPCNNCHGKCVIQHGYERCLCFNGGTPPLCISEPNACLGVYCGNAECQIHQGKAVCVCPSTHLQPLSCAEECKCANINEVCNSAGQCVCPSNYKQTGCKFCSRDCGQYAFCVIEVQTSKELCYCSHGGIHPNCNTPYQCHPKCKNGEVCAKINGGFKCLCQNGMNNACLTPCNNECGKNGRCVKDEHGASKCVCLSYTNNWPNCDGPCDSKMCISGQCLVKNGEARCVCEFDPSLDEDDVNCNPCSTLNCEMKGGICVLNPNGKHACMCKNYQANFPHCKEEPEENCDLDCGRNGECVFVGGHEFCKCRNDQGVWPDCKHGICNTVTQNYCRIYDAECYIQGGKQLCVCNHPGAVFPHCKEKEIPCDSECKGVCVTHGAAGRESCICSTSGVPPKCIHIPIPCDGYDCGYGYCVVDSKGKPTCVCYSNHRKCPSNAKCDRSGTCVCSDNQASDDCRPICSKNCGNDASCKTLAVPNILIGRKETEVCICNHGGSYPYCKSCTKHCSDGSVCAFNAQFEQICLCPYATVENTCGPRCSKQCDNGKCIVENGQETCICLDNSRNYPDCSSGCNVKQCPGGFCTHINNRATCVCPDGSQRYPHCAGCAQLNCERHDGRCIQKPNEEYACVCRNGQPNYPDCRFPSCDCPTHAECVFAGGQQFCKCKNNKGRYPECKGTEVCTEALQKFCAINNGVCVVEHYSPKCMCQKGSSGIYPFCGNIAGECRKVCKGTCVVDESTGKEVCICLNGGIPNTCRQVGPCDAIDCKNAKCVVSYGTARCVCEDKNLIPPYCDNNQVCGLTGKCSCEYSPEGCGKFCQRDCGHFAHCVKAVGNEEEICLCHSEGKYPNCHDSDCDLSCDPGYMCVRIGGRSECLCSNLLGRCTRPCKKSCPGGKCVLVEGRTEECVCLDNTRDYPACSSPCLRKSCPGGECIISTDGRAVCVCPNQKPTETAYPDCGQAFVKQCRYLHCEEENGVCVRYPSGRIRCACKNGYNNFPRCSSNPSCTLACPVNTECVYAGGREFCACKQRDLVAPLCKSSNVCTDLHIQKCEDLEKVCVVEQDQPKCVCRIGDRYCDPKKKTCPNSDCHYPNCNICKCKPCKDGELCYPRNGSQRTCIECKDICKGSCIHQNKRTLCVCRNGGIPPLCKETNPCVGKFCGNAKCHVVSGRAICICDSQGHAPDCNHACRPECRDLEYCRIDKCVCKFGGQPGSCERQVCQKRCGSWARCLKANSGEDVCLCHYGGKYPNCKQQRCSPRCNRNEICVKVGQEYKCLCKNTQDVCTRDVCKNFYCNYKAMCVEVESEAKCICKDHGGTYPECNGPCSKHKCNGFGKCIIEHGSAQCICNYEHSTEGSDYPICDNPCKNLDCSRGGGECAIEENGEATCICRNKEFSWPFCGIFKLCDTLDCGHDGECIIVSGVPFCKCINNKINYPECDKTCSGCGELTCVLSNKVPQCLCPNERGAPPHCEVPRNVCKDPQCKFPDCDICSCKPCRAGEYCIAISENERFCKSCQEICQGTCTQINSNQYCVCDNGGIPPACNIPPPCRGKFCGNAKCKIIHNKAVCVCDNGQEPPDCNDGSKVCNKKCSEDQYCNIDKCVCKYGGQPGNCDVSVCTPNDCDSLSRCIVVQGEKTCVCNYDGNYPSCNEAKCNIKCKTDEICVKSSDKYVCICKNKSLRCQDDKCKDFHCNFKGECVEVDGQAKCICKGNRGTYPNCNGPCSSRYCNGYGKCIVENGHAHCVCNYEHNSKDSDYPFCDNPCRNRNCLHNGICAVENNGEATCICKDGAKNWPYCIDDPDTFCKHHQCSSSGRCVVISGLPTCICKNGNNNYPACTSNCPQCKNQLQCSIDNKFPRCICPKGVGTLPECKQDVCNNPKCKFPHCDPCSCQPCKQGYYCVEVNHTDRSCVACNDVCKGRCLDIHGSTICVCDNGGIPPQCNVPPPCHGVKCGNAQCEIINGIPRCICRNGEDNPPHCSNFCNGCKENEYCKIDQCVCLYGGRPGHCKPPMCANKFCGKNARCIHINGVEKCVCNYGGNYPDCEVAPCNFCKRNEICVKKNEKYDCICIHNCQDECKGNRCNEKGYCIVIEGKPVCICKDNGGVYPHCSSLCSSEKCNGHGKCIIENGHPHCVCEYENSASNSDYPTCGNPCKLVNCLETGDCAVEQNGVPSCVCRNGNTNWPICSTVQKCYLNCGPKGECILVNGLPKCACKNGFENFPECSKKCTCSPPLVCGRINNYPICLCPHGKGTPPTCEPEEPQCIPEDCGSGAQCKYLEGTYRCVCYNGKDNYPECTQECRNCIAPYVCVVKDKQIQCICEDDDCEKTGCSDDGDCADDAVCKQEHGRRTCVCPVPKNEYYKQCSPDNCDVCKCNPCPYGLECKKVRKFGLVARICLNPCKRCIFDACPDHKFCQCSLKFPDNKEYFGCQYPDCDVCKCAPCKHCTASVSLLGVKSRFCDGNLGEVECQTNLDCLDKCSYCRLVNHAKRVCTCRPSRNGKQCPYGKCGECCPDNCEVRNGRRICGICRNDQDCPIEQECGRPDLLGVRRCRCICRGDPYTEGCEWPCNKCVNPVLFKKECGDYENHAACYPPSGANPKAFCHCHYNKYRRHIPYSSCKPFRASVRCRSFYNVDEEIRKQEYAVISQQTINYDVAFGDVFELSCKKGCIELFKSMYYCDEVKGMELGLAERHLKIGQAICDGHERCALQAIGGIFDIGDHWKYCQDNARPYRLWVKFSCTWPDKRRKIQIGRHRMRELYRTLLRFDKGRRFLNYQWEPGHKCFGICNTLDRKYGLSAMIDKDVREHVKEVIDLYPGFDRGRP